MAKFKNIFNSKSLVPVLLAASAAISGLSGEAMRAYENGKASAEMLAVAGAVADGIQGKTESKFMHGSRIAASGVLGLINGTAESFGDVKQDGTFSFSTVSVLSTPVNMLIGAVAGVEHSLEVKDAAKEADDYKRSGGGSIQQYARSVAESHMKTISPKGLQPM